MRAGLRRPSVREVRRPADGVRLARPVTLDWTHTGKIIRQARRAGCPVPATLAGPGVEEEYGGSGVDDFRYHAVLNEELRRAGATSVVTNVNGFTDLIAPYLAELATPEQTARWLPTRPTAAWSRPLP